MKIVMLKTSGLLPAHRGKTSYTFVVQDGLLVVSTLYLVDVLCRVDFCELVVIDDVMRSARSRSLPNSRWIHVCLAGAKEDFQKYLGAKVDNLRVCLVRLSVVTSVDTTSLDVLDFGFGNKQQVITSLSI